MYQLSDWHVLVDLAPQARAEFDRECLVEYEAGKWYPVLRLLHSESPLIRPRTVDLKQEVLEGVFGAFGPDHAFNAFTPDWGITLHETQATRGLSYLLNRGEPKLRAKRIRAFLEALEVPDLPDKDNHALKRARVFAEKDKIDLEIRFPASNDPMGNSCRVVIIEAKFESSLGPGQLEKYYNSRKQDFVKLDCRIIGLTPKVREGLEDRQRLSWRVYLWRDVWLRFEKLRPEETDGQLASFMALLWQRIGGLTPKSQ